MSLAKTLISEPKAKRVMAFFDGQNLFNAAKEAFCYMYPNYDPLKLANEICSIKGWNLSGIRFYTGMPDCAIDSKHHNFWAKKLAVMGTRGIISFTRPLRYKQDLIYLSNGNATMGKVGREKGIDIRIALDMVRFTLENKFDVALVFSQDQDFSEAVKEIVSIAKRDKRWVKVACAFPIGPATTNSRGINGTDWITIDRELYDKCIDPVDYR